MKSEKLALARISLDRAIKDVDMAQNTWSECVAAEHMAEINLRVAQRKMRESYNAMAEVLYGDA